MINLFVEKMKMIGRWIWQKPLDAFLLLIGVALFVVLILVMFNECVECWIKWVLDSEHKRDAIKVIGLGIAGVVAIFGAVAVNRRAEAQVNVADAQVRNNELVKKGHVHERFKAAVEHLGNEDESARIASFYEFSYLVRDNNDLREHIFDILRAHLRRVTTDGDYRVKVIENERTTEEVQCLLDVLFRSTDSQDRSIFARSKPTKPTLREIFLVQANLYKADLRGLKLQDVDLRYANLQEANLQDVDFQRLSLKITNLEDIKLQDRGLHSSDLNSLDLRMADLRGANLLGVKNLGAANLKGAKVKSAIPPEGFEWPAGVDTTTDVDTISDD